MRPPLAITGCALLTPLDGQGCDTWTAIRAAHRIEAQTAVSDNLLEGDPALDRSIRIGLTVARRALAAAPTADTSLYCATSKGPVGVMLAACDSLRRGIPVDPKAAEQIALGVGAMGAILRRELALDGPAHTSVAACASGLHALHRAAFALRAGECRRALVVAADASLHPLFSASFARLGVLSPPDSQGVRRCEPFSEKGSGFFIAEGGAALLLEAQSPDGNPGLYHASATCSTPPHPLAWLEQSWSGADASALVAIDPRTDALRAGLAACAADGLAFVHAHATGTAHDAYELEAIRATVGPHTPVFSHKAWLGHTLGGAGLVGVALSLRCHQEGVTLTGDPVPRGAPSLILAQGFGGHIGVVRLRGI